MAGCACVCSVKAPMAGGHWCVIALRSTRWHMALARMQTVRPAMAATDRADAASAMRTSLRWLGDAAGGHEVSHQNGLAAVDARQRCRARSMRAAAARADVERRPVSRRYRSR